MNTEKIFKNIRFDQKRKYIQNLYKSLLKSSEKNFEIGNVYLLHNTRKSSETDIWNIFCLILVTKNDRYILEGINLFYLPAHVCLNILKLIELNGNNAISHIINQIKRYNFSFCHLSLEKKFIAASKHISSEEWGFLPGTSIGNINSEKLKKCWILENKKKRTDKKEKSPELSQNEFAFEYSDNFIDPHEIIFEKPSKAEIEEGFSFYGSDIWG